MIGGCHCSKVRAAGSLKSFYPYRDLQEEVFVPHLNDCLGAESNKQS